MSMPMTLVCDAAHAPLHLVPAPKAAGRVLRGAATLLVADEERRIRSASLDIAAPVIVSVPRIVRLSARERSRPSRRLVFARDNYRCQYCNRELHGTGASRPTIDHVKPRSRFERAADANTWENVVTACVPCNARKRDRLPMECGMYPKTAPREPGYVAMRWTGRLREPAHIAWVADYYRMDPDLLRIH